jgi:archaemetzincin
MYPYFLKLAAFIIVLSILSFLLISMGYIPEMKKKLYIIPIGEIEAEALAYLQNNISQIFNIDCQVHDAIAIPPEAYDSRRGQYYSPIILQKILNSVPASHNRILGVIDVDLYVQGLNFIFGQADLQHGIAIISITRLRQEYYGLPPDKKLFYLRMLKEAVHELGHTYGLDHCTDFHCVMYFSNSLQDTDRKGVDFCRKCKAKLKSMYNNY